MAEIGYLDALKSNPKAFLFLLLFGTFGLYYGYRVGSAVGKDA